MNEPSFSEKLNLGCGDRLLPGFINIDRQEPADLILDLEKGILPFKDNTFKLVSAEGLLEQIKNLVFLMNEVHRVLKPDGIFEGLIPNARCYTAFQDPETKRFFVTETFTYFQLGHFHNERYNYGYLPWKVERIMETENGLLQFSMRKPLLHEIK